MKYTRFEVKNFKGINRLELDLSTHPQSQIVTLVGLNESGKTTILEALDYLQLGIGDSDPLDLLGLDRDDPHDLIPIAKRGNFNGSIEISVSVQLDDDDIDRLTEFLDDRDFHTTSPPTSLTINDAYRFEGSTFIKRMPRWTFRLLGTYGRGRKAHPLSQHGELWQETVRFLRNQMPAIWYFPNFLFDFPRRIYLDTKDPEDKKEAFYRDLLSEILSAVDNDATLEQHISQRIASDNPPDKTSLNQLLLQLGRLITNEVFESWNEIFQRRPDIRAVFRADTDQDGYRYLELSIEDNDGLFYIDERSLGFRWFFVFLLITKYKLSGSGRSQGIVYLFDEPASNLHAGAQSQLLASLERLSSNCTIIYTTHSHHLINPYWLENTYVVKNQGFDIDNTIEYSPKGTDITIEQYRSFANHHPDQTRYFQPILDVLDYKPSPLEMVPDVVLVEGKNDFYTLGYMSKVIGLERTIDIQMVPGNGAGSLDAVIRLYLGWAKNFVVLLDSDSEGENQKLRYLNTLGPILNDRLYTLGDLCPELIGKRLEDAFTEEEQKGVVAATYPSEDYSKKRFNRSIQELLVTNHLVNMSSSTTDRFSNIFAQLNVALTSL